MKCPFEIRGQIYVDTFEYGARLQLHDVECEVYKEGPIYPRAARVARLEPSDDEQQPFFRKDVRSSGLEVLNDLLGSLDLDANDECHSTTPDGLKETRHTSPARKVSRLLPMSM